MKRPGETVHGRHGKVRPHGLDLVALLFREDEVSMLWCECSVDVCALRIDTLIAPLDVPSLLPASIEYPFAVLELLLVLLGIALDLLVPLDEAPGDTCSFHTVPQG